jgi:hypothetical protein
LLIVVDSKETEWDAAFSDNFYTRSLTTTLIATFKKYQEVTRESAKERYRNKLANVGIPETLVNLTVENTTLVHAPFFVGLLRRRDAERLVAIDADNGKPNVGVSESLTANMAFVRKAIGADDV